MITNTVGRYLTWQTLQGLIGAFTIISSVLILVDFVETSRDLGTRTELSSLDVLGLTLLKTPLLLQDTLPFIVLFGVLWSFFRLNRRSELIVLKASGYSIWRMIMPPLSLSFLLGLFGMLALNPLGASMNATYEQVREDALGGETGQQNISTGPVWLREHTTQGFIVIYAEQLQSNGMSLQNPVFNIYHVYNERPSLERRIEAKTATLNTNIWLLNNAIEYRVDSAPLELTTLSMPTSIGRQALFERARSPGGVSFWRLPDVIVSARQAGLSVRPYELQLQSLLSLPLFLITAALIAIAATLRLVRLGGAAAFALTGGAAGFLLYFSQELMMSLGSAGTLSPLSAAWSTSILFCCGALYYIATTEDG